MYAVHQDATLLPTDLTCADYAIRLSRRSPA